MVLAPEHPLVAEITTAGTEGRRRSLSDSACASKSDMDRGDLNKDKSGVFTGAYRHQPGERREDPRLDRRLRDDGLRHRRDHGRARA